MYSDEQRFEKMLDQLAKGACLMRRMPASEKRAEENAERDVFVKMGVENPPQTQTQLKTPQGDQTFSRLMGKPLTGALLGALAGGAGGYALEQLRPGREDEERQPWSRALTGALGGGALGGGLGAISEFKPTWFGGRDIPEEEFVGGQREREKSRATEVPGMKFMQGLGLGAGGVAAHPGVHGALGGGALYGAWNVMSRVSPRNLPGVNVGVAGQALREGLGTDIAKQLEGGVADDLARMSDDDLGKFFSNYLKGKPSVIGTGTAAKTVQPGIIGQLLEAGARVMRGGERAPLWFGTARNPSFTRGFPWFQGLRAGLHMPTAAGLRSGKGLARGAFGLTLPLIAAYASMAARGDKGSASRRAAGEQRMRGAIEAGR